MDGVTGFGNPANQTTDTGHSGASSADEAEFGRALNQVDTYLPNGTNPLGGRSVQEFVTQHGVTPSAKDLGRGLAESIRQSGQQDTHRVASAIIHDGKVYFGVSKHEERPVRDLQNAMRSRTVELWNPKNCAEVQAMNGVVRAGYNPQHMGAGLQVFSGKTDTGEYMEPCGNCTMFLGLAKHDGPE
jgi:hypothetical protein